MTGLFIIGANLRRGGKLHLGESFFIKTQKTQKGKGSFQTMTELVK